MTESVATIRVVGCTAEASSSAHGASGRVPYLWAVTSVSSSNVTISSSSESLVSSTERGDIKFVHTGAGLEKARFQ